MANRNLRALLALACVGFSAHAMGQSEGSAPPSPANRHADCVRWNTEGFFRSALPEDITACLAAGADPSARDGNGWTPLHVAARLNGSAAVTEALLAGGADPSAQIENGQTPLHLAAGHNANAGVIEALLDAGANAALRDGLNRTPWDLAKDNEPINRTDAYWRLNEARFDGAGEGQ